MKHDIVYILKNDVSSDELRISLRSVCMNFPYRKIVFVGGCPDGIKPDIYLPDDQIGQTKWQKARHSMIKAFDCDELTEDVWLFNDDFFIMDKVKSDVNYTNGTLERRIMTLRKNNPRGSNYINNLTRLRLSLFSMNRDTLSFALHVPMLVNRGKALDLINKKKELSAMFRSLYGNYYEIDCQYMKDVKVYDLESVPDTPYISTTDESFRKGKVGDFLRQYFDKPCKYEKTEAERLRENTRERYTEEGEEIYDY